MKNTLIYLFILMTCCSCYHQRSRLTLKVYDKDGICLDSEIYVICYQEVEECSGNRRIKLRLRESDRLKNIGEVIGGTIVGVSQGHLLFKIDVIDINQNYLQEDRPFTFATYEGLRMMDNEIWLELYKADGMYSDENREFLESLRKKGDVKWQEILSAIETACPSC